MNSKLSICDLNFRTDLTSFIIIRILLSVSDILIQFLILVVSFRRLPCVTSINVVGNGGKHSSLSDEQQSANYQYGRPKEHAFQRPVPV